MKTLKFLFKALKILVICAILYVGYAAFTNIKTFFKNPWDTLVDALPFSIETKVDVNILEDELLKKSEYIFAENKMKLEYKFHRKVRLAEVDATYQWDASTKFGITKDCFKAKQIDKDLNIEISKIIIFQTACDNIKRTHYDENWGWNDQGTTERAFRQDMPFATRDAFNSRFSNERKQEIIEFAKESLVSFVKSFIGDKKINIIVKVDNVFESEKELGGNPSGYYKDQKKNILEDLTSKTT